MDKDFFDRGIEEIINEKSFMSRIKSGKRLRIKFGVDPTKPDIHLGHGVSMWRLKELQDAGHTIIFLIGDYTTKIGDPSGRNTTRPVLSDEEIKKNAKTYLDQAGKILDLKKAEIAYNSKWFKKTTFANILQLAGKFTVAGIIERDDFNKRLKEGIDISFHELLYPLMQAYDSVVLKADVEFGGSDQRFNLLAGRELQKKMGQAPQEIITTPLLIGLDGKQKMSKSAGNYIGITESPETMFGKVMSIPDQLIVPYFELCTKETNVNIDKIKKEIKGGQNPKEAKEKLAQLIVELYHGADKAEKAKLEFTKVFSKKELPSNIPEVVLSGTFSLPEFIVKLGATDSKSAARRLVEQGAIKVDGTKLGDPDSKISTHKGMVIQVGKIKFYKIK